MTIRHKWLRARPYRLSKNDVKALVRHRDGYRCVECGMTARQHFEKYRKNLDVHRIVPGSKYTLKGCETLCKACHKSKPKSLPGTGTSIFFRPESADLVAAIDALALLQRRSRNQMIQILLEEALAARGAWPPPSVPAN